MNIALVSRTGEAELAYVEFLRKAGVTPVHFTSISQMYRALPELSINGFILDLPVIVKATKTEKLLLQGIETIFPNLRTNWSPQAGFRALFSDSTRSGEENLLLFLEHCSRFKQRSLRKDERKPKNFNVLIWQDGESEERAHRAFTTDVSAGGLFVCICDPYPIGSIVWIKLLELDERPFRVEVRWELAWGVAMRIPGFGGKFAGNKGDLLKILEAALC